MSIRMDAKMHDAAGFWQAYTGKRTGVCAYSAHVADVDRTFMPDYNEAIGFGALAQFLGDRKREDTMPNIQDYVLWRGDLPLERVPLCDVDALLLSYLSYMPYDHIAGDAFDEGISLRDAAQKLLEVNERNKTPLAYNVREDRKLLAALMETSTRSIPSRRSSLPP